MGSEPVADVTIAILATRHPDGSITLRYSGPVGVMVAAMIEAFAGGFLVEQVLTAEELAEHALLSNGVIVFNDEVE